MLKRLCVASHGVSAEGFLCKKGMFCVTSGNCPCLNMTVKRVNDLLSCKHARCACKRVTLLKVSHAVFSVSPLSCKSVCAVKASDVKASLIVKACLCKSFCVYKRLCVKWVCV